MIDGCARIAALHFGAMLHDTVGPFCGICHTPWPCRTYTLTQPGPALPHIPSPRSSDASR